MLTAYRLTSDEELRLAMIRSALKRHRAMGRDVSSWEATFFLRILEKLSRKNRQAKRALRS